MFASDKASNFRLMKLAYAGGVMTLTQYNLQNAFGSTATNMIRYSYFKPGTSLGYFLGNTKSMIIDGPVTKTFTQDIGYVMNVDYTLESTLQSAHCIDFTVVYATSITLSNLAVTFQTYNRAVTKTTKSLSLGSVTYTALKNLNAIDQSTWCPAFQTVTIDSISLVNQVYEFGAASPVTTYTFPDFTISAPACSDTPVFSYTAILVGGAALPTFIVFNPLTRTFSWAGVALANIGTYNIQVTGIVGNG